MIGRWMVAACVLLLLGGCGLTDRQVFTTPDLPTQPRPPVALNPPIALTVTDDQSAQRSGAYAGQLAAAIARAYPGAVEVRSLPVPGRVNLTVHIRQLGAQFTNQRSSPLPPNAERIVPQGTVADWAPVVAATAGMSVSGSAYVFLPGNWGGVADLVLELRDLRPGRSAAFSVPIAAAHMRPNDLGFVAARAAAAGAWDRVAPRVEIFLDAAVTKLRAE